MAITRQSITLGAANLDTTGTCAVTVNAGTNRLMVAAVSCEDASAVVAAPTFSGQTFTQAPSGATAAGTWSRIELWRLIAPNVASGTVSVGVSGPGADRVRIAVWVFDGVDQTTPLRTCAEQHGESATSASATVSGVQASDFLIDAATVDSVTHVFTAGANQTERYEGDNGPSGSFSMYGSDQAGTDGGVMSTSWTVGPGPYSYLAAALIASGNQFARPDGDITDGTWVNQVGSNVNLYASLDETSADTGDFIASAIATSTADVAEIRLSDITP